MADEDKKKRENTSNATTTEDGGSGSGSNKRRKFVPGQGGSKTDFRGAPGLLVTCPPGKEKYCVRELFNLLDECCKEEEKEEEGSKGKSIAQKLEDELKDLRDRKKNKYRQHKQVGMNGVIFIQFYPENGAPKPLDAVLAILKDAVESKKCKARWIIRMLPVETSCYSSKEDISKMAEEVVASSFPKENPGDNLKFAIRYEHRASSQINRLDMINSFAHKISQPPYKVDLKNPDRTILVQIVKNTCFVAVVKDYEKFLKFNLQRLVEQTLQSSDADPADKS